MSNSIVFTGEESARFTKFSQTCLKIGINLIVEINGREPLTSQHVHIKGKVLDAKLDGYIRYIVVQEIHSNIKYWIAGSNATRSIATKSLKFDILNKDLKRIKKYSLDNSVYIAFSSSKSIENYSDFKKIEKCLKNHTNECLTFLLKSLNHFNKDIVLEAALSLRSYWEFIIISEERQKHVELSIHTILSKSNSVNTKISLVEDLGYIGTSVSINLLSELVQNTQEHSHIRWAASIALGRLPNVDPVQHLIPGLNTELDWVVAGTLLSITRRIDNIQSKNEQIENIFLKYIETELKNPIFIRYACLGLSRLERLNTKTLNYLINILSNTSFTISNRGYAAIPLVSNIENISNEQETKISQILVDTVINIDVLKIDPEGIWALEFLCDLAVLLELESVTSYFYKILSSIFNDWRSSYYQALSYYELAELNIKKGDGESAILYLEKAKTILPNKELPDGAYENIKFKKDIFTARLQVLNALNEWIELVDTNDLLRIEETIYNASRIYMTYAIGGNNLDHNRHLIKREVDFLKNTVSLLSILSQIVKLDYNVRKLDTNANIESIKLQIFNISENIKPLKEKFKNSFARTLQNIISKSLDTLDGTQEIIESNDILLSDKLKFIRTSITNIKSLFGKSTWPIPGRSCPISGLGKGSFQIYIDGLNGTGTDINPLEYPKDTPVLLKIIVDIEEMAPGGITTASIICKVAGKIIREQLPIVEGPYTCTLLLPNVLSPVVSIKCDVSLVFEARDCSQSTYLKELFIKSI